MKPGFDSEGFSYFLTTQMRQTSPSPYHSKLVSRQLTDSDRQLAEKSHLLVIDTDFEINFAQVRVCHDDSDYYSYTEIPIECVSQGLSYTLVQVPT